MLGALTVLVGFRPGFAEVQDTEQLLRASGQADPNAQDPRGRRYANGKRTPGDSSEAAKRFISLYS